MMDKLKLGWSRRKTLRSSIGYIGVAYRQLINDLEAKVKTSGEIGEVC